MTGTPTSLSMREKKPEGMLYQGSGISFFTMSTGMAET